MRLGPIGPAALPPTHLPELEPSWSRLVTAVDTTGVERTWHVLDNQTDGAEITLLCVHGNPTWSYLWRKLLRAAPDGVRVVAVDHLDMGYSERTGTERRLAQRIEDLETVVTALDIAGPVVTVAHDWGGPISLGWGGNNLERLAGVVLMNTAVHQPEGSPAPTLIRMARSRPVLNQLCVRTAGFIAGTLRLVGSKVSAKVKPAFHAPYRQAWRRRAIGFFVDDIPLEAEHPSTPALAGVVDAVNHMRDVPALMLWGTADPVFSDLYLRDLSTRLPHAAVHRYEGAGHLVSEDVDVVQPIFEWVAQLGDRAETQPDHGSARSALWSQLDRLVNSSDDAVVEMVGSEPSHTISFSELAADVARVGAGLVAAGVQKGDRVSLLVPPGIDLTVCLYACWRIGAVAVIADAGLGARGMTRALKSAAPRYVIAVPKGLAAAKAMRWPGRRISVEAMTRGKSRALGVWETLDSIRSKGEGTSLPEPPVAEDLAVVVFTSGATGPAKGVVYRHGQAQAQRDALMKLYGIEPGQRLVAAFAPFALYGPAMGITAVVPDMEVTSPGTLEATALAGAVAAVDASMVFASPAALVNVLATAGDLSPGQRASLLGVRLLMSAGAPVPSALLHKFSSLVPNAELHTPYGMTEVLPVADISLAEVYEAGRGAGVCVGMPVDDVDVAISPIDDDGETGSDLSTEAGIVGEICIRAEHARDRYDKLWVTNQAASSPAGWHRSGDVGHFDTAGRLWVEGRMVHMIKAAGGVITTVGVEHAAQTVAGVARAAAVGVGPAGTQLLVVVVVPDQPPRNPDLASDEITAEVRRVVPHDVAAVLAVPSLPVDKRHNSKIDRIKVSSWAEQVLSGGKVGRL